MASGYKRATQRKHRCMIENSDTCRRAGIAADQFSKNGLRIFSWEAISPSARTTKLGQFGNAARLIRRGVSIL